MLVVVSIAMVDRKGAFSFTIAFDHLFCKSYPDQFACIIVKFTSLSLQCYDTKSLDEFGSTIRSNTFTINICNVALSFSVMGLVVYTSKVVIMV